MDIQFDVANEVIWISLGISLIALITLTWLEVRKKKTALWARGLAVFLVLLALNLLAWQPSIKIEEKASLALLLTNGSEKQTVDSIQSKLNIKKVIDLKKIVGNELAAVIKEIDNYETWMIMGVGPPLALQAALENKEVMYYPSGFEEGWLSLDFPTEIEAESTWEVKGQFLKTSTEAIKLNLKIAGQIVDSLVSLDSGLQNLAFRQELDLPAGKYLFEIEAITNNDTLQQQLPVVVKPKKKAKYLILSGFPNFEWKYLKDYLGDEGHEVFYSTQISKDKNQIEVVNSDLAPQLQFTDGFLTAFDACFLDVAAWRNLNSRQKRQLLALNEKEGLGLILLTLGEKPENLNYFKKAKPQWQPFNGNNFELTSQGTIGPVVLEEVSWVLNTNSSNISIFPNIEKNSLAIYIKHGFGRQGIAVWPALYPFILKGEAEQFQFIYQQLLEQLKKPMFQEKYWSLEMPLNTLAKPISLTLHTSGNASISSLEAIVQLPDGDSVKLKPAQDAVIAENYHFTFFPVKEGWYQARMVQDTAAHFWFYVQAENDLGALTSMSKIVQHIEKWGNAYQSEKAFNPSAIKKWWTIPQWYFFIILLLSLSFLWLMDKIYS